MCGGTSYTSKEAPLSKPAVKLIAITPDAEKTMAYVARVSSPNQANPDTQKLLAYCMRNAHWSVFEHAFITLEIETSRAIARQLLRHRSFSFSEFSQRYSQVKAEHVPVQARRQDTKNRQASHTDLPKEHTDWFAMAQMRAYDGALNVYREALRRGIAKECARAVLPEGMTPSRLYMSGSVRSWLHYLQVRLGNGTQQEHMEVARAIQVVLKEALPDVLAMAEEVLFEKQGG
jgi:thymidylate synthase (FAD)